MTDGEEREIATAAMYPRSRTFDQVRPPSVDRKRPESVPAQTVLADAGSTRRIEIGPGANDAGAHVSPASVLLHTARLCPARNAYAMDGSDGAIAIAGVAPPGNTFVQILPPSVVRNKPQ